MNKGSNPIAAIYNLFEKLNGDKMSNVEYIERITNYLDQNIVDRFTFPSDASRILIQTAIAARENMKAQKRLINVYSRLLTDTIFGTHEFFQLGQFVAVIADLSLNISSAELFAGCKLELPFDDRILTPPKMPIKISSDEHFSALAIFWCSTLNKFSGRNDLPFHVNDYEIIVRPIGNYLLRRKWKLEPRSEIWSVQVVLQTIEMLSKNILHEDSVSSFVSMLLEWITFSCSYLNKSEFYHKNNHCSAVLDITQRAMNVLSSIVLSAQSLQLRSRVISQISSIISYKTCRRNEVGSNAEPVKSLATVGFKAHLWCGLRRLLSVYQNIPPDIVLPSIDSNSDALSFHSHCALITQFMSSELQAQIDFLNRLERMDKESSHFERTLIGKTFD